MKRSNAPRQAIALNYDGQNTPTVSAKGDEELAEAILAIARDYEVPIYENADLVRVLARLELGDAIPEELYRMIAEVIAFAWYLKGKSPAAPSEGRYRDSAKPEQRLLAAPVSRFHTDDEDIEDVDSD
ncbi:MAG: Flagellar biosynthetic protein FlhB [Stenotrophomonas maltophilia]|nr:MAG: Flagellar biosynthetic protein FlhB [Stenotrophomonas maltophilia]